MSDCFRFGTTATRAELWNPVTGERKPLTLTADNGRTAIDLTMAPRESYFVVLSSQSSNAVANTTVATTEEWTIEGPWQVQFDESIGAPAEPVTFNELDDWAKHSDPRIRYYSGMAAYSNTFVLAKKDKHASYQLRLPLVNAAAEVIVNGKRAGVVWCSPWSADITKQLRMGKNQIELRVCNTLWNRLVGDANRPEAERIMVQSHELAKPDDRLVPSGIVGKVTICAK